jgi:LPXTG-site transpeptidase (sortase) family protein
VPDIKNVIPKNNNEEPDIIIGSPKKILIPKLGIDTKVVPVGKNNFNNLDVPNSLFSVGWYKNGPRPGEVGNAVIDGHEVDEFGLGVIFKNLYLLKPGDSIVVEGSNGENLEFIVSKVGIYKYTDAPLEEIFGPTDSRNLNLITCDGHFIPGLKTKNMRLVVYSTLKS